MFREEQEVLSFLLKEEFTDMEQSVIRQFQDEAEQAYVRLPQPEAALNAQVVMLGEIAIQLASLNEHMARIDTSIQNHRVLLNATLERIAKRLEEQ